MDYPLASIDIILCIYGSGAGRGEMRGGGELRLGEYLPIQPGIQFLNAWRLPQGKVQKSNRVIVIDLIDYHYDS